MPEQITENRQPIWMRILQHLYKYRNLAANCNGGTVITAPYSLCQAGIAEAVGITRAHAVGELLSLRRKGLVEVRQAHIGNLPRRRKVFALSSLGLMTMTKLNGGDS